MVSKQSRSEIRVKKHVRLRNRFSGTAERPRLAVFRSNNHMYAPKVLGGLGVAIISTNQGVITDKQARELGVGGEVLAFVW